MSKDFTIVPQDYIVHHIKTDDMFVHTKDGDYAYHVKTERIPLIRCRECKYFRTDIPKVGGTYNGCGIWIDDGNEIEVEPNQFCSYGERAE